MALRRKGWFLLVVYSVLLWPPSASTQGLQPGPGFVDRQCVSDDENFTTFFDFVALSFAFAGFLLIPMVAPVLPGIANTWKWVDPGRRWRRFASIISGIFLLVIFLPPQLARFSLFFRPFGLVVFHSIGNVRLEYLDCNLSTVPKDYGFFFFLRWSPGFDLIISYWWAQLMVFVVYAVLWSAIYFILVPAIARRNLETIAK